MKFFSSKTRARLRRCGAFTSRSGRMLVCIMGTGHITWHRTRNGDEWSTL